MDINLKAYGKLNLTLNVLGAYSETHHSISSLLTTVNVFDTVNFRSRADKRINVYINDELKENDNLKNICVQAVDTLGVRGMDIYINKGIPSMAGMGGSSASAAAALFAIKKLYHIQESDILSLAAKYGSDISYLIRGGLALAEGKGDTVTYYNNPHTLHFAVIKGENLITANVFKKYDENPSTASFDNSAVFTAIMDGDFEKAFECMGNALQQPAFELAPSLKDICNKCINMGLKPPIMTGSGGHMYYLCLDEEDAKKRVQLLVDNGIDAFYCMSVPHGVEVSR
jgi:4-diphosphocytidyl-2-C-methyl-D-erythritol kinase